MGVRSATACHRMQAAYVALEAPQLCCDPVPIATLLQKVGLSDCSGINHLSYASTTHQIVKSSKRYTSGEVRRKGDNSAVAG